MKPNVSELMVVTFVSVGTYVSTGLPFASSSSIFSPFVMDVYRPEPPVKIVAYVPTFIVVP